MNWRVGQDRSIVMTEFWVPFAQPRSLNGVLYGSLRMMGDNQENREGNLGVGYRHILGYKGLRGVAGVHGWLDRRITERGSKFNQFTGGLEWLGESVDVRLNGYLPLSDANRIESGVADTVGNPFASGTGIFVERSSSGDIVEEPQYGFDWELGWETGSQFDFVKDHTDSLRVYGGGYYFDGDNTESVLGWGTRIAADLNEDFQIGARFQRDDQRGSQGFLEATFRFPFGQKKSFREDGLRARLDESPERDIDIIVGEQATPGSSERAQAINNTTGSGQEVLHVDNTAGAGGDGSVENPFNTLAAAQAAASAHTIIYVNAGDGTTTGQDSGIALNQDGQQLIGAGSDFLFDNTRFQLQGGLSPANNVIITSSAAPQITNTGGDGVTVTGDNTVVKGVQIDATTNDGIVISNAENVVVQETSSTANANRGLFIESTGAANTTISLLDNVITSNQADGVELSDAAGGGSIDADFGGGSFASTGQNNIFGNANNEINADLDGGNLSAQNNFWGGGALTDTTGADAGNIDSSGFAGVESCTNCLVVLSSAINDQSNIKEGTLITSNAVTLNGFTGTRVLNVSGDGSPELVVNGTPTGSSSAPVKAGDTLAIRSTSAVNLLQTATSTLAFNESDTDAFSNTTENFLEGLGDLSLWLDASDLDADFDYADNPANGTSITVWNDKSTYADVANKTAGDPDPIELVTSGIGGQPTLRFDGTTNAGQNNSFIIDALDDRLVIQQGTTSGFTFFSVLNLDEKSGGNRSGIIGTDGIGNSNLPDRYGVGGNNRTAFRINTDVVSAAGTEPTKADDPTLDQDSIYTHQVSSDGVSAQNLLARENGVQIQNSSTTTLNPISTNILPNNNYVIGARDAGNDNYSDIDYSEIIVFDSVLNATQIERVEEYLSTKYGIPVP